MLLDTLLAAAAASPDAEVCGLLFGRAGRPAPAFTIDAICPARNVSPCPSDRFELDPAVLFAALRAERVGGPPLLGHYHSHPRGPAEPSACDAAAAGEQGRLWLILGGGGARLWRAVAAGPVRRAFAPIDLVIRRG